MSTGGHRAGASRGVRRARRASPSTSRRSPPGSSTCGDTLLRAADRAGYGLIELPVFEDTALYARGVGESTDVVSKEMYTFADRGDRSVTLRPEGTAGVVRAVIEHGLDRGRAAGEAALRRAVLPLRAAAGGALPPAAAGGRRGHRGGRPGAGRRGDRGAPTRASARWGCTGYRLELTSLGDAECRPAYGALLREFLAALAARRGHPRAARRSTRCGCSTTSAPRCRALLADAPLLVDHLSASSAEHHAAVKALPGRPRRGLRGEPADGARAGLLHEDHLRVRPRRAGRAVRASAAAAATTG